jgi:hypothetical protein
MLTSLVLRDSAKSVKMLASAREDDMKGSEDDMKGSGDDMKGSGDDMKGSGDDMKGSGDDMKGSEDSISADNDIRRQLVWRDGYNPAGRRRCWNCRRRTAPHEHTRVSQR